MTHIPITIPLPSPPKGTKADWPKDTDFDGKFGEDGPVRTFTIPSHWFVGVCTSVFLLGADIDLKVTQAPNHLFSAVCVRTRKGHCSNILEAEVLCLSIALADTVHAFPMLPCRGL